MGSIACVASSFPTPTPRTTLQSIGEKNCPAMCEDVGKSYDCRKGFGTCTNAWDPMKKNLCHQDKKYCSAYDWLYFCERQVEGCTATCLETCGECMKANECSEPHAADVVDVVCESSCLASWYQ